MATLSKMRGLLIPLAFLACTAFLAWPGLIHSQVPAFRDAYHFYYPQAVWLDQRWQEGELFPQWNADEGLGISVAGQGSSALYYPLRFIWLLPGCTVAQRYSIFILVHLVIAACGAAYASQRLGCSRYPTWLAAIAFALSCPVFFQHSNLVYLCGASWSGFAAGALISRLTPLRTSPQRHVPPGALFSLSVAMMVLAGDPQSGYHAILLSGLAICLYCSTQTIAQFRQRGKLAINWQLLIWFASCVSLVVALTAIQWIPSYRSARATQRFVPEISADEDVDDVAPLRRLENILQSAPADPHRAYAFSLSPWHLLTAIWPTIGGGYQPSNTRWFAWLPSEGRMWIPSIYFGFFPCLLVLSMGRRTRHPHSAKLTLLAAFCLLAAFGSYTIIWALKELMRQTGGVSGIAYLPGDATGGLYWLLTFLPGYESFRYPAKWTTWFALAISLLAACQAENASSANGALRLAYRPALTVLVCTIVLMLLSAVVIALDMAWPEWLSAQANQIARSDNWLGNFQLRSATWNLLGPCLFSSTVLAVFWGIRIVRCSDTSTSEKSVSPFTSIPAMELIVLATLIEMTFVSTYHIEYTDAPELESLARLDGSQPQRILIWADTSQANINRDIHLDTTDPFLSQCRYQEDFALGKLGSIAGVGTLHATHSLTPAKLTRLRNWLAFHDKMHVDQPVLDTVLRDIGVTHRLVRQETNGNTNLFWYPVQDISPLCELLTIGGDQQANSDVSLSWRWLNSSSLEISYETSVPKVLLFRQRNDGGWFATSPESANVAQIHASLGLFMYLDVPPGRHTFLLRRKLLW